MVRLNDRGRCVMLTFDRIKRFYNAGLWTKKQVRDAVAFNKITTKEYHLITNEPY